MSSTFDFDVAIVGGGPGGATTGALLKQYAPDLRVVIVERDTFPRDHVGESLLPPITGILEEMDCWDKIEAANFPVKVGATYRWGKSPELWDFDFLTGEQFEDLPSPGKLEGQRKRTAFQVDRAIYDDILLNHAKERGCEVLQPRKVVKIHTDGDSVDHLDLDDGSQIRAKYYIDASGHSGIMRRALGVQSDSPTTLHNIAIWDYWQNTEWAVKVGVGGTRVYIMSLGYGWIWFIPIGPTRTSVGLVVPAEYYKKSGLKPDELYAKALAEDPLIVSLMKSATSEQSLQTTKDWSFVADRICGENWFLVGESAGFADPILSAGLTMTHLGGREAAYTILDLLKGQNDAAWLKQQFNSRQRERIMTHIRFADYWYTANSQFKELKEFTSELAKNVGLDLSPDKAWAWLAQGGFISQESRLGIGGYSIDFLMESSQYLSDLDAKSPFETYNVLRLNLEGATKKELAIYKDGTVTKREAYVRGDHKLPVGGAVSMIMLALQHAHRLQDINAILRMGAQRNASNPGFLQHMAWVPEVMEAMIHDGWITATYDPESPIMPLERRKTNVRWNQPNQ